MSNLFGQRFGVKLLSDDAKLPTKGSILSAGYDLYSGEHANIWKGERLCIALGFSSELPDGYYGRIADRSGLAFNFGLTVLAGVIDNDYRGEWKVILHNTGDSDIYLNAGTKIAQVVLTPYGDFDVEELTEVNETARGEGGFGSTG